MSDNTTERPEFIAKVLDERELHTVKDKTPEEINASVRNMLYLASGLVNAADRRRVLEQIKFQFGTAISADVLQELETDIHEAEELAEKQGEGFNSAAIGGMYGEAFQDSQDKLKEQSLFAICCILDSICDNCPAHVSAQAKQNFVTTGAAFFNQAIAPNGQFVQPVQTMNILVAGAFAPAPGAAAQAAPPPITKAQINALVAFAGAPGQPPTPAHQAAVAFNAAAGQLAQEVRQDQQGVKWDDLPEQHRTALNGIEATRAPAAKLVVVAKRAGIVAEFQKLAANRAEEPDQHEADIGTASAAFQLLSTMRGNNEMEHGSALSKLEELDRRAAERAHKAASEEIKGHGKGR